MLRHQVAFVKPLVFRREPVLVDTWVTDIGDGELTLSHEVYDAPSAGVAASGRTVHLRATTVLAHRPSDEERAVLEQVVGPALEWRAMNDEARPDGDVFALIARHSDMDERGVARPGVFFEYVQEARIRYLMNLHTRGEKWSQHVVARTDMDYLAPLTYRQRALRRALVGGPPRQQVVHDPLGGARRRRGAGAGGDRDGHVRRRDPGHDGDGLRTSAPVWSGRSAAPRRCPPWLFTMNCAAWVT